MHHFFFIDFRLIELRIISLNTGYVVEKCEVGGAFWVRCNDYNVVSCDFTAINLTKGQDEFRVFAVNAAGRSDRSTCASAVKVRKLTGGEKPQFVRPLVSQGVPMGRSVVFECEASGIPCPRSRWMKNGREIVTGGRLNWSSPNCGRWTKATTAARPATLAGL